MSRDRYGELPIQHLNSAQESGDPEKADMHLKLVHSLAEEISSALHLSDTEDK